MAKLKKYDPSKMGITRANHQAIKNVAVRNGKALKEYVKHGVEEAVKSSIAQGDKDTKKITRKTLDAAVPVVKETYHAGMAVSNYINYLRTSEKAATTIEKYVQDGSMDKIHSGMEKVGLTKKASTSALNELGAEVSGATKAAQNVRFASGNINVKTVKLDGLVNQGTVVNDVITGKFVALNDFSDMGVVKTVDASGHTQYKVFTANTKNPEHRATVSEATFNSWVKKERIKDLTGEGKNFTLSKTSEEQIDVSKLTGKFKRKQIHYELNGGEMRIIDLSGNRNRKMYRDFRKYSKNWNKINSTDKISKDVLKKTKKLEKVNKKKEKYFEKFKNHRKKLLKLPKTWRKMLIRQAFAPLKDTDTGRGIDLSLKFGKPIYKGAKKFVGVFRRHMANRIINTVYNVTIDSVRAYKTVNMMRKQGMNFRSAWRHSKSNAPKKVRLGNYNKTNPLISAFKQRIKKGIQNAIKNGLIKLGNRTGAKIFTDTANRIAIEQAGRTAGMSKDAVQLIVDTQRRNLAGIKDSKKIAEKTAKKSAKAAKKSAKAAKKSAKAAKNGARTAKNGAKVAKNAAKATVKTAKVVFNAIRHPIQAAKSIATLIQRLTEAIRAAAQAVAKAIQAVAEFVAEFWWAILIFLALLVIAGGISMMVATFNRQATDLQLEAERFTTTNYTKWESYTTNIMDALHERHVDYENKIKEVRDRYSTADIIYPSGLQENYKELFAAVEISIQFNPDCISYEETKEIVMDLYDKTHTDPEQAVSEYDYNDADGTPKKAAHLYINIQRQDALCYEALADNSAIGETGSGNTGDRYAKPVNVQNDDWLAVVEGVASTLRGTGTVYSTTKTITVNGKSFAIRCDCSGFVSGCLYVYDSVNAPNLYTSSGFTSMYSLPKFEILKWAGWQNLAPGDIIARNGHVEIFKGRTATGQNVVWSWGSTNGINNSPTHAGSSGYTTVLRPLTAGGGQTDPGDTDDPDQDNDNGEENGGGNGGGTPGPTIPTHSLTRYESDTVYPYTSMFKESDYTFPLSNTDNIERDNNGNEVGYENALVQSIRDEMNSSEIFTSGNFEQGMGDHTLKTPGNGVSTSDFVRYIFAKHGVTFDMDDRNSMFWHKGVRESELIPGDVIIYVPKTLATNELANNLKNNDFRTLDPGLLRNPNRNGEYAYPEASGGDEIPTLKVETLNGEMTYLEVLSRYAVPMIYIGDDKVVSYSRDVTSGSYMESQAAIREYSLSSLEKKRIINKERITGFTVSNIFGNTPYFEGWINKNIAILIELVTDDCWGDYKKFGNAEVDYTWYYEDYFERETIHTSDDHVKTFFDELMLLFVKYYYDYGLLPSYGYSYCAAISGDRSSEESLRFFNIFELPEDPEHATDNGTVEVVDYDIEQRGCGSIVHYDSYKVYSSYKEAYEDFYSWINSKMGDKSCFETSGGGRYTQYANQYHKFDVIHGDGRPYPGFIKSSLIAAGMESRKNEHQSDLNYYDNLAIERYNDMVAVRDGAKAVRIAMNAASTHSKRSYTTLENKIRALANAIKTLKEFDQNTGCKYVTQTEVDLLVDAVHTLADGLDKAQSTYDHRHEEQIGTDDDNNPVYDHWPHPWEPDDSVFDLGYLNGYTGEWTLPEDVTKILERRALVTEVKSQNDLLTQILDNSEGTGRVLYEKIEDQIKNTEVAVKALIAYEKENGEAGATPTERTTLSTAQNTLRAALSKAQELYDYGNSHRGLLEPPWPEPYTIQGDTLTYHL